MQGGQRIKAPRPHVLIIVLISVHQVDKAAQRRAHALQRRGKHILPPGKARAQHLPGRAAQRIDILTALLFHFIQRVQAVAHLFAHLGMRLPHLAIRAAQRAQADLAPQRALILRVVPALIIGQQDVHVRRIIRGGALRVRALFQGMQRAAERALRLLRLVQG